MHVASHPKARGHTENIEIAIDQRDELQGHATKTMVVCFLGKVYREK
jgi:hypothetical protein